MAHNWEMAKIDVLHIGLVRVRKLARKMSRANGESWIILQQKDSYHIMTEEQYDKMPDKKEFQFIESVTRIVKE